MLSIMTMGDKTNVHGARNSYEVYRLNMFENNLLSISNPVHVMYMAVNF